MQREACELFQRSRGFKSSLGAPGEARVKEKRHSCGHSLYSQHLSFWDCIMSKERPKRNIIQKKYVSTKRFFFCLFHALGLNSSFCLCSMKRHKLSLGYVEVTSDHNCAQIPAEDEGQSVTSEC